MLDKPAATPGPENPDKFRHVDELFKMMAAITYDDRFIEILEGGRPTDMCELLDRVEEKGIKKGIEKGIEKGIAKGIDQNRVESIRNIMESFKVTAQQAMEALKIPEADQPKYLSRI